MTTSRSQGNTSPHLLFCFLKLTAFEGHEILHVVPLTMSEMGTAWKCRGDLKDGRLWVREKTNEFICQILSLGMNAVSLANEILIPRSAKDSFFFCFFMSQFIVTEQVNN